MAIGILGKQLSKHFHGLRIASQHFAYGIQACYETWVRPVATDNEHLFASIDTNYMNTSQIFATCSSGSGQSEPLGQSSCHDTNLEIKFVECFIRPVIRSLAREMACDSVQPTIMGSSGIHGSFDKCTQTIISELQPVRFVVFLNLGTQIGQIMDAKGMYCGRCRSCS